ncbi:protein kinase domain-containing protein [Actinomycetospora sp. CA-053990]|uniref:serine/threonine-protein kinase n=1 Tax=Actinomycetospora sp. CA-053990 TaxID=3239891 RepID=UPI003D92C45F
MTGSPGPGAGTTGPAGGSAEMFGPYRLTSRLGRGGMGEVHRAYDTRRDREVALKRLAPDLADDPEIRERFERECRTAARLSSPHVVPIHDFGVIDGRLYLDMRLVDGRDLARLLREEGPLDPARAVGLVEQLADALDDAHAHDLVHRDVKPGNVLVTTAHGRDFVHLVDFGIVRLGQGTPGGRALTEAGTTLGTLAYMAPEQFEGATVDRRADVYALAVVLYEILVGRPPFDGDMPAMLHQHLNVDPQPPSVRRPGLPPALDAVVLRGLAKRPGERFGDAGELAAAARAALDGRAPAPIPDPPGGRRPDAPPGGPGGPPRGPEHQRETWVGPAGPPSYPPYGQGPYAPAGGPAIRWDSGPHASGPLRLAPSVRPLVADDPRRPARAVRPARRHGQAPPPWPGHRPGRGGRPARRRDRRHRNRRPRPRRHRAGHARARGGRAAVADVHRQRPGGVPAGRRHRVPAGDGRPAAERAAVPARGRGDRLHRLADRAGRPDARRVVPDLPLDRRHPHLDDRRHHPGPLLPDPRPGAVHDGGLVHRPLADGAGLRHQRPVRRRHREPQRDRPAHHRGPAGARTGLPRRDPARVQPGHAHRGDVGGHAEAGARLRRARGHHRELHAVEHRGRREHRGERARRAVGRRGRLERAGRGRLGPLVQTEDGGPCRTFVGWDAVAYSIEVAGPSCEAVDRAVTALAPPPLESLPA